MIGYYNYYDNPHRYSPTEIKDRYQEMVDRYNDDELHAYNEDPYSSRNLARRELDESLSGMAGSVRNICRSESQVHQYLSEKYFGTADFVYTKKWDDPKTYAMFENDYNAICYGTIGSGNFNDPRLNLLGSAYVTDEAEEKAASQRIISGQFSNLLNYNSISLKGDMSIQISIDPYTYQLEVNNSSENSILEQIELLLNKDENAKQLYLWGLMNGQVSQDAMTKWRAYQNVMQYTGIDLSTMSVKDGKYCTNNGTDLLEVIKEGISKDESIAVLYKSAAFEYVSSLVNEVADKGWDNMKDADLTIMYTENSGFYLF